MKSSKLLNVRELEAKFEVLVRNLVKRVGFMRLTSIRREARVSSKSPHRADILAHISTATGKWTLVVEAKSLGQPREVRTGVLQLERQLRFLPKDVAHYGLMVAPFISEESAKICTDAGIGYADLAGNARLAFDQVFIETRAPGNPFREKRETRSIFAPRATRVLRALLQGPLRPWKVTDLAESARVSVGWVSAVRQQLLAREWAAEALGGFRVTKPGTVLDAWSNADDWGKRTRTHEYSVLHSDPVELAQKLKEALPDESPVFTQWFAGWLRRPYTTPVVVTAYVKELPDATLIKEKLSGRRVSAGEGGLRLVLPKDEGVIHPTQTVNGFELVSDVQIYVDLLRAGLRGGDQAEELRRAPDFAGGWK